MFFLYFKYSEEKTFTKCFSYYIGILSNRHFLSKPFLLITISRFCDCTFNSFNFSSFKRSLIMKILCFGCMHFFKVNGWATDFNKGNCIVIIVLQHPSCFRKNCQQNTNLLLMFSCCHATAHSSIIF